MNDSIWRSRLTKAAAISLAVVLCVPAVDALGATDEEARNESAARQAGIDAQAIIGDGDLAGFAERLQAKTASEDAQPPAAFAREVGLPADCRNVHVDASGTVVGCTVAGTAEDAAAGVRERMTSLGWAEVGLGAVEGATYVKEGGTYSWVLVTCTQVGDATTIVYRCVAR